MTGIPATRAAALLLALGLGGCVSTEMKSLVGSPIQEAQIRYGAPEQVIDMPGGARAYQFRAGGGTLLLPSSSTTTATVAGPSIMAQTTGTPGGFVRSDGCLLTFIAHQRTGAWIIDDIRVPKGLVC